MEFPAFLFGGEEEVSDRAEREGEAWRAAWQTTGALPPGALRPIAAGELVILDHGMLDVDPPRWRLFGAATVIRAAAEALHGDQRASFERYVRGTPWGALGVCVRLRPPNTVDTITERAHDVIAAWEPLATLRYIGAPTQLPAVVQYPGLNQEPIDLDAAVAQLFRGPLAMWAPPDGSVRARLTLALSAMAAATRDDAIEKLIGRLVELANASVHTRGTPASSPATVAVWLAQQDDDDLAELVPGADLQRVVAQLSRTARPTGRA